MSKKHRNPKDITCPECNGAGSIIDLSNKSGIKLECWYCLGTKTATDEPHEQKDWEC